MGQVSAVLAMDRTTVTANLKPLERRGLVEVQTDDHDRRSRRLKLTAAGRRLLAEAMPIWEKTQSKNKKLVPASELEKLLLYLRSIS